MEQKSDPAHQQCRSFDLLPITIIPYLKQNGVPLSCHLSAKIFLVHSFCSAAVIPLTPSFLGIVLSNHAFLF